jgi:hypothetical protein
MGLDQRLIGFRESSKTTECNLKALCCEYGFQQTCRRPGCGMRMFTLKKRNIVPQKMCKTLRFSCLSTIFGQSELAYSIAYRFCLVVRDGSECRFALMRFSGFDARFPVPFCCWLAMYCVNHSPPICQIIIPVEIARLSRIRSCANGPYMYEMAGGTFAPPIRNPDWLWPKGAARCDRFMHVIAFFQILSRYSTGFTSPVKSLPRQSTECWLLLLQVRKTCAKHLVNDFNVNTCDDSIRLFRVWCNVVFWTSLIIFDRVYDGYRPPKQFLVLCNHCKCGLWPAWNSTCSESLPSRLFHG